MRHARKLPKHLDAPYLTARLYKASDGHCTSPRSQPPAQLRSSSNQHASTLYYTFACYNGFVVGMRKTQHRCTAARIRTCCRPADADCYLQWAGFDGQRAATGLADLAAIGCNQCEQ